MKIQDYGYLLSGKLLETVCLPQELRPLAQAYALAGIEWRNLPYSKAHHAYCKVVLLECEIAQ